jgi:iron complex outermembrane receptor protein
MKDIRLGKAALFRKSQVASALVVAFGGLAVLSGTAQAQGEAALERVEVTGSAIKNINAETSVPVTVVKMDDLKKQGITTVEQVLASVTGMQSQQTTSQVVGSGTGGASFADMRGLGANKTLVLLNGRRVASNSIDGSSVDLNMIPFAAIDRIEVLRDGASSLYGSDAIGGVINFITKKNFQGGVVTIGLDTPQGKGGKASGVNVGFGFGDLEEKGFNVFGFVDSQSQSNLRGTDREVNKRYPGGLSVNPFPANYYQGGNYGNPSGPACASDPAAGIYLSGAPYVVGGCKESTSAFVDYLPKEERQSAFVKATKKIDANNQASLEYFYTQSKVQSHIAPVPYYGVYINPNTPFFPGQGGPAWNTTAMGAYDSAFDGFYAEASTAWIPGTTTAVQPGFIYANWRDLTTGPRMDSNTNTQQRFVASWDGSAGGWDYQAALTYNQNEVSVNLSGYTNGALINEGMITGIINPFGAQTAEGLAYIKAAGLSGTQQVAKATSTGIDGHASRELSDWFGAGRPVSVAVGGSYSSDKMSDVGADLAFNQAVVTSTGFDPATSSIGSRRITAAFTEFNIPVSKQLELTAAARDDSYSDFGNSFNPKFGFRFQPSKSVLVRGSASTGFRAPSLYEMHAANTYTNTTLVTDPVTGNSSQFIQLLGGNPDLKPEKSKTATLGLVLEPAKNMTMSADLWVIQMTDSIGNLPDTTAFADPQFTNLFHRNSAGNLSQGATNCPGPNCGYVDLRTSNLGGVKTNGLDLGAAYRLVTQNSGALNFGLQSTYVNKYDYQDYANGPWNQNVGKFVGTGPIFKWTHTASVAWSKEAWGAGLVAHYKSGYTDQDTSANKVRGGQISSYATYDTYVSWQPVKALSITAGVHNLLDKAPPLSYQVYTFQAGYDPRFADPTGRAYYLRGTYSF